MRNWPLTVRCRAHYFIHILPTSHLPYLFHLARRLHSNMPLDGSTENFGGDSVMRLASIETRTAPPKPLDLNDGADLVDLARSELSHHDHFRYHTNSITLESQDGHLVITGRLPSFYLKQMLQTVLSTLPEVQQIDNRIDVVSCHGLSSTRNPASRSAKP